jgi:ubiquinone/menaquinone biosynthesis C-methylase UbiE
MTAPSAPIPNHHAHHPGFSGPTGLLLAVVMAWGRAADPKVAMELGGVGPDDDVVDVGCGSGAAVRRAAGVARSVVGVDPAPVMLRVARWFGPRGKGIRYREGPAEQLPLDDGTATVLWSLASVHHWQDVDRGLDEARRVLRPGGRLVAIERLVDAGATGMRSHGWTPEQAAAFAGACTRHGFEDATVEQHTTGRRRVLSVRAVRPAA